jgi:hypothetical protein
MPRPIMPMAREADGDQRDGEENSRCADAAFAGEECEGRACAQIGEQGLGLCQFLWEIVTYEEKARG